MTEKSKENCNFQQTYNVFGLDDKSCCYLYHKYCEEINNCYFKRCKRLEQENKELKEENITAQKEYWKLEQGNDFLAEKVRLYRSALEEIKKVIKGYDLTVDNGASVDTLYTIRKIINEVLNDI